MPPVAALLMVVSVAASAEQSGAHGVELTSAQVLVKILEPVRVRQESGYEKHPEGPVAQVTRREREILIEFQ